MGRSRYISVLEPRCDFTSKVFSWRARKWSTRFFVSSTGLRYQSKSPTQTSCTADEQSALREAFQPLPLPQRRGTSYQPRVCWARLQGSGPCQPCPRPSTRMTLPVLPAARMEKQRRQEEPERAWVNVSAALLPACFHLFQLCSVLPEADYTALLLFETINISSVLE